jgi:hypothetical protein
MPDLTCVTSRRCSTIPDPGRSRVTGPESAAHSCQARYSGRLVSNARWPPGRSAAPIPRRVSALTQGIQVVAVPVQCVVYGRQAWTGEDRTSDQHSATHPPRLSQSRSLSATRSRRSRADAVMVTRETADRSEKCKRLFRTGCCFQLFAEPDGVSFRPEALGDGQRLSERGACGGFVSPLAVEQALSI